MPREFLFFFLPFFLFYSRRLVRRRGGEGGRGAKWLALFSSIGHRSLVITFRGVERR